MYSNMKDKDSFLKQANDAREKRQNEKKRLNSIVKIQANFRGYLQRKRFFLSLEEELKEAFGSDLNNFKNRESVNKIQLTYTSSQIYELVKKILVYYSIKAPYKKSSDLNILLNFTSFLILNVTNADLKHSYLSLILSKEYFQKFLAQSHKFLSLCLRQFTVINIKDPNNYKLFSNIISLLILFTESKFWKCFPASIQNGLLEKTLKETSKNYLIALKKFQLFEKLNSVLIQNMVSYNPIMKSSTLFYLLSLSLNLIESTNYDETTIIDFCRTVLTIPCIMKLLQENLDSGSNEASSATTSLIDPNQLKNKLIDSSGLAGRIYSLLANVDRIRAFVQKRDDINILICFLGNLCSLSDLDLNSLKQNLDKFIYISHQIFLNVSDVISPKQSTTQSKIYDSSSTNDSIKWHPIFGYLKLKSNINNIEVLIKTLDQLKLLWSHRFISILFDAKSPVLPPASSVAEIMMANKTNFKLAIRAVFDKITVNKQQNLLNSPEAQSVYRVCSFYRQLLLILNEPRIEILSALSFEEEFLLGLWNFMKSLGPNCGLRDLVALLETSRDFKSHPIFDVLYILASLVLYLVTVLDENEFYVQQKILKLADYKSLASFLNHFIYQIISRELIDSKTLETNPFFSVFHQLLLSFYVKDSRKPFSDNPEEFWIIKDIRIRSFVDDLEREKNSTLLIIQKIPHALPTKTRIEILKNKIEKDRESVNGDEYSVIRINIRRSRLIEDAIVNLASLPVNLLKSSIRVTFINEYGLKEAGIDQDGVFKEFLQETISELVNPKFQLFQLTSDQLLYPSPSSYFVDDHLKMFEFAGRMIGKAIYESLVVDVEFAPFFLRQLSGHLNQNYSFLDDLATLDYDLYKNLNLIKHEDNVSDLELTFTHSEYHLGKLVTHELVPSGEFVKVTNENKIKYIHLMAHFKLHKQIREQIFAFNEGLKSVVKQEWLNMFSVSEIQRLISGSLHDLNLEDLKKNVQYWGGLHSSHRLVKWLWEIVENDFSREERCLFLKFVTSCPKPPLLGFSSLNPPFTIRCVENEEEEGTIYDSSIRGFFKTIMNIGGNDTSRLPTSSTCFNLLKLPNYAKKSTLREKLRYAIKSNSGFELS